MNLQTRRIVTPIKINEPIAITVHNQCKVLNANAGYISDNPTQDVLIIDVLERWGSRKYDEKTEYIILLEPRMKEPINLKSSTEIIPSRRGRVYYEGRDYYLFTLKGYGGD